jgi:sterol desaturase/sphingolipid hydroxylase (fatty acid hydroxylase superfamily)
MKSNGSPRGVCGGNRGTSSEGLAVRRRGGAIAPVANAAAKPSANPSGRRCGEPRSRVAVIPTTATDVSLRVLNALAIASAPPGRRFYLPAISLAFVTAWFVVEGVRTLSGLSGSARAIGAGRAELLGPAMIGFLALTLLAEHRWPAVRRPVLSRGHRQDVLYLALYAIVVIPLVALLGVGFAATVRSRAPWLVLPRFTFVPHWVVVGVSLVVIDATNWFVHLANHRVRVLWRFHALHHSQEEMTVLTTFRAHPLVHSSFLISAIPTLILVANGNVPPLLFTAYAAYGAFAHANVDWDFGALGRVFVSPAYHRVHHQSDGPIDVNLGTVLTIWDLAAHRAVFVTPGSRRMPTGLRHRPVPVEQSGDAGRLWATLGAQLIEPFWRTEPDGARPLLNAGGQLR